MIQVDPSRLVVAARSSSARDSLGMANSREPKP
jgi:hypothetical protein